MISKSNLTRLNDFSWVNSLENGAGSGATFHKGEMGNYGSRNIVKCQQIKRLIVSSPKPKEYVDSQYFGQHNH